MAKKTATRKQLLKEPDQFITFSGRMIAFGRSHVKLILTTAGVLVAVLLTVVSVRQMAERNELKASAQVEKVIAKYTQALSETNPEEAYHEVKTDFQEIFDQYGSNASVNVARIFYGDISYLANDGDTAIGMYQKALEDFGDTPALKNLLLSSLSHAYLLKGKDLEAIHTFEKIAAGEEATLKSGALFNLASLYEASGDTEKSSALYKQLLAEFPNSLYGDVVKEKING